jgi:hypothetical protein
VIQHLPTRSNLQSLFSMASVSDTYRVRLAKDLFATGPRIARALQDDAVEQTAQIATFYVNMMPRSDQGWLKLLRIPAGRTVCTAWAATGEELAARVPGTPAERQFPGAAQALAQSLLRADVTFYSVTLVEPGMSSGTRFHLVFWDGSKWCMLGPAWRAVS